MPSFPDLPEYEGVFVFRPVRSARRIILSLRLRPARNHSFILRAGLATIHHRPAFPPGGPSKADQRMNQSLFHHSVLRSLALLASLGFSFLVAAPARAGTLVEKFSTDPAADGWQASGNPALFAWDPTHQVLNVTWDSTQTNSYYYHPLGLTLTTNDGFVVQFDLTLSNAVSFGYGQELAIGLLNWNEATNADFSRTIQYPPNVSPDLVEFDYFPAYDYGGFTGPDTVTATVADHSASLAWGADYQTLASNVTYHVVLIHYPATLGISATLSTGGRVISTFPLPNNYYPTNDSGAFALDTLAVMSYSDDGYGDDIYAQGTIANLACASPLPVNAIRAVAAGQVQFTSDTNWVYTLEQSTNLQTWSPAGPVTAALGTNLTLTTTHWLPGAAFYRVRADLP